MAATMTSSTAEFRSDVATFEPRWEPRLVLGGGAQGTARVPGHGGPTDGPRRAKPVSGAVYWRRRLLAGLLLVIIGAGLWTIATWVANSSIGVDTVGADRTAPLETEIHVVQPGDTLWSIATEIAPADDVRATVDRLADLNGGASLEVGQRLIIDR